MESTNVAELAEPQKHNDDEDDGERGGHLIERKLLQESEQRNGRTVVGAEDQNQVAAGKLVDVESGALAER